MKILCHVGMSLPLYGPFGEVKSYIAKGIPKANVINSNSIIFFIYKKISLQVIVYQYIANNYESYGSNP